MDRATRLGKTSTNFAKIKVEKSVEDDDDRTIFVSFCFRSQDSNLIVRSINSAFEYFRRLISQGWSFVFSVIYYNRLATFSVEESELRCVEAPIDLLLVDYRDLKLKIDSSNYSSEDISVIKDAIIEICCFSTQRSIDPKLFDFSARSKQLLLTDMSSPFLNDGETRTDDLLSSSSNFHAVIFERSAQSTNARKVANYLTYISRDSEESCTFSAISSFLSSKTFRSLKIFASEDFELESLFEGFDSKNSSSEKFGSNSFLFTRFPNYTHGPLSLIIRFEDERNSYFIFQRYTEKCIELLTNTNKLTIYQRLRSLMTSTYKKNSDGVIFELVKLIQSSRKEDKTQNSIFASDCLRLASMLYQTNSDIFKGNYLGRNLMEIFFDFRLFSSFLDAEVLVSKDCLGSSIVSTSWQKARRSIGRSTMFATRVLGQQFIFILQYRLELKLRSDQGKIASAGDELVRRARSLLNAEGGAEVEVHCLGRKNELWNHPAVKALESSFENSFRGRI